MNTAMRWRVASAFTSAAGLLLVVVTAAGCFGGTTQRMGSVDGYVFKPAGYGSAAATAATADPARGVATEATSAAAASVGTGPNANASPGAVGGPAAITATAAARGLRVGPAGPRGAPPTGYEPCAGAVVSVTGSTGVARTDANGYFRKDGVSPGTQTVSIVYEPFRLETRVIVRSGQVTTVNQTTGSLLGKWTIMVYMCADNNLESAAIADMNELEEAGSTSDVNILVQIDRAKGYDTSNYDWPTTRRYYITPDSNAPGSPDYDTIVSPMASWDENDTEVNIADPASGVSGEAKEAICAKADVLLAALSGPWLYAGGPAGAAYGNGLSIYLPDRETWAGVHGYDCLQFEQYTRWSDVFQYVDP